jgi:hypothetical protein
MDRKKNQLLASIISLIVILNISCENKEENIKPTIHFLQPDTNLIIANDTVVSFIVEPYDKDGTIDRVEFSLNGTFVLTVLNPPYQFDWSISTESNIGNNVIKATAYDNNDAKAEAEIQLEIKSYLEKWAGSYEGTSDHWISEPCLVNDQWQIINNHSYKKVFVNVNKSSQDSCLYFKITYNDSIIDTKDNLFFSTSGVHISQWGGGSSHGSLHIKFESDSLYYRYSQMCGMSCIGGIKFIIEEIREKYGRKVKITTYHEEERSVIESLSPDIPVSDILKEFILKTYNQYVRDSEIGQKKSRRNS